MNVVSFFRERADDDLRPVPLWIIARHQLLKDRLVLVVVTAESLHEAPQTALHGHGQHGILQTDTRPWEQKHRLSTTVCICLDLQLSCKCRSWNWQLTINWLHESKPNYLYGSFKSIVGHLIPLVKLFIKQISYSFGAYRGANGHFPSCFWNNSMLPLSVFWSKMMNF